MPYRALIITVVTCALGLLASALYLMAAKPYLVTTVGDATTRNHDVELLTRGTLLLVLILVSVLLGIGMTISMREWMRMYARSRAQSRTPQRTAYVDAWKIAGERMQPPSEEKS